MALLVSSSCRFEMIPARLKFLRLISLQIASAVCLVFSSSFPVLASGVTVTSYGHSALLIKGGGKSVLLNPFKAVGCAAGLKEPRLKANVILASSELADEGARIAKGTFFVQPGSYRIEGMKLEGFAVPHDRVRGRRFGQATIWIWEQGGLNFAHMGGTAAPLSVIDKVLLGRPDVLVIGVGGGPKVYNGMEAAKVVQDLNPRRVIPVQYLIGAPPKGCEQKGLELFLDAMPFTKVRNVGKSFRLPRTLGEDTVIEVLR